MDPSGGSSSINPNAYQEALLRARQLAAKLTGKRPLEEDESPPPEAKRPSTVPAAVADPIGAQLASFKQQATLNKPSKNMLYLNGVVMNGEKTLDIMIPGNKVGYVIGKGGEMIRNLQERAGVKMTVFQDTNEVSNSEKQLRIIGEVDKVDFARQLVTDLLTEKEIETIRMKTGPKSMTNDYGTMRGGNTVEVPVSPQYIGLVIGKGGENIRRIQQESNAKVQFDTTKSDLNGNKLCIVSGMPDAVNRAVEMVKEIIDMGMRGKKPMMGDETRIGVPAYKTGTVIGRGGETIRSLKQQCGCDIELDKNARVEDDPEQKYFLIRGPPEKVSYATQLIQERVGTISTSSSSGPGSGMSYNELSQQWSQYWQNSESNSQRTNETPTQDANAAWAAYYAQYYAQFQQTGQSSNGSANAAAPSTDTPSQPGQSEQEQDPATCAQKWAEYYRAYGMHKEADHYEQMAKNLKNQQPGDSNHNEKSESSLSTSAAPVSYPGYNYSGYHGAHPPPPQQQQQQQHHQPQQQHHQHH